MKQFRIKNQLKQCVPNEFQKVLKDFYKDILLVFPEMKYKLTDETIEFFYKKKMTGKHIFD